MKQLISDACVVGLAQQPPSTKCGEHRFEAQQDRHVSRGRLPLGDDLKEEGDADREDSGIEDLPGRLAKGSADAKGLFWPFDQKGRDESGDGDNRELKHGEFDRVGLW